MSATNHTPTSNGSKKSSLQQNGAVNSAQSTPTPQTPNGSMVGPQTLVPSPPSQSTSPPVNNAPKYGTLVPNRVFVGGISANTTEGELAQLFSAYGTVKATKIISDRAGVSKGYGFVTFESEEEAKRLQRESDNIMLRERRLNIAPAIKKQPFSKSFDVPSPPPNTATQAQFYYAAAAAAAAGGVPYAAYQNGMAYYASPPQTTCANGDPNGGQPAVYQTPPVYATPTAAPQAGPYPMPMYPPQPLFLQQQYPYQPIHYDPQQYYGGSSQNLGGPAQYMYSNGAANTTNGNRINGTASGTTTTTTNTNGGSSNSSVATESGASGGGTGAPTTSVGSSPSNQRHHQQQQQQQQHYHQQQQHASSMQHQQQQQQQQQHNAAAVAASYYAAAAAQHLASYNACPQDAATAAQLYYNLPLYAIDPAAASASSSVGTACYNTESLVDQLVTAETTASSSAFDQHQHNRVTRMHGAPLISGGDGMMMVQHQPHPVTPGPLSHGAMPKHPYIPTTTDRTRNASYTHQSLDVTHNKLTHTPVVSLLSVGQANERDYQSMQGGRKQRPLAIENTTATSTPTTTSTQSVHIYPSQQILVNGYNKHHNEHNQYRKTVVDQCDSNQCRTWAKKRRNFNTTHTAGNGSTNKIETSSTSSLRTNSNSSASAFDENLNEKTTQILSNKDAYTSSMTHLQITRIHHQPANHVFQQHYHHHHNQQQQQQQHHHHHHHQQQQQQQQQYYSSNGSNGARRNRRNNNPNRRNHHHQQSAVGATNAPVASTGATQQEIGAGDAPVTNEVQDMCKKMDTIKL